MASNKTIIEGVEQAADLLMAASGAGKTVLGPIPKNPLSPCCSDRQHCANIGDPLLALQQLTGIGNACKLIRDATYASTGRRLKVIDLAENILQNKPDDAWAETDILSQAAYDDILSLICPPDQYGRKRIRNDDRYPERSRPTPAPRRHSCRPDPTPEGSHHGPSSANYQPDRRRHSTDKYHYRHWYHSGEAANIGGSRYDSHSYGQRYDYHGHDTEHSNTWDNYSSQGSRTYYRRDTRPYN